EHDLAAFLHSGQQYGFAPRINDALEFAQRSRVLLLQHLPSRLSIDISLGLLTFEREMIDRAKTFKIGDLSLKLPTPEDLIITKAVAQRPKDIADIDSIINIETDLDLERIKYWTKEFADALDLPEIHKNLVQLLQKKKSFGKKLKSKNKKGKKNNRDDRK